MPTTTQGDFSNGNRLPSPGISEFDDGSDDDDFSEYWTSKNDEPSSQETSKSFNSTDDGEIKQCIERVPMSVRVLKSSSDIQTFKRVHFVKSKDANHCIEQIMDLLLLIQSLMMQRHQGEIDILQQKSDLSAQFENTFQRLLYLRYGMIDEPVHETSMGSKGSMRLLMACLHTMNRLKIVLSSIRNSAQSKFDVFLVMGAFFVKAETIIRSGFSSCSRLSLQNGIVVLLLDGCSFQRADMRGVASLPKDSSQFTAVWNTSANHWIS